MKEKFTYEIIKNPMIFEQNRMEAHASFVAYANPGEMEVKETSLRMSLNGLWHFSYAKNTLSAISGFERDDYDAKSWDSIYVPAHIQMEGFDKPHYTNTTYPWDAREELVPGQIPEEFNPVASYVKYFTLPDNFEGKRTIISFQGVESGFALWLNGQYVGYSENSFDPAEFDLTEYLVSGENKLAVRVWKWTSSSWCEDQDFFRFSGIFRDVFLQAIPEVHVWDLSIEPLLRKEEKADVAELLAGNHVWDLHVKALVSGKGSLNFSLSKGSRSVFEQTMTIDGEESKRWYEMVIPVERPRLWSAEEPNLYELFLQVVSDNCNLCECMKENVGFRHFEMKDGLMLLNGKRIVFKGVNRHEFNSVSGRVPRKEDVIKDILTMKRNNINAIRTSHYPDDTYLYELCDQYGLYMIAENNMESHGSFEAYENGRVEYDFVVPGNHEEWMPMMLDRVNSCYQRDKNHPAILIWSCGNESHGGKVIFEMSQLFRKLDPHRLVHYEGIFHDRTYNDTSDMESQMYPSVAMIKDFLAENKDKPFICCEYTHAMGNSCGGMYLYTDLTDEEPRYQGGFIWDYIDQSIYKKDRYGKTFLAYGGDFDERPSDYIFSGNGIVYGGEREASPKMQEVKYNYQNISVVFSEGREFTVKNKNLFVTTDAYEAVMTLSENGLDVASDSMDISVAPLSEESYAISSELMDIMRRRMEAAASLKKEKPEYVFTLSFRLKEDTLWAKAGHEVAFGQKILKTSMEAYSCKEAIKVVQGMNNLGLYGENFSAVFSTLNPGLTSYVYGGVERIKSIPMPNFWRAPVDNDCGNLMQQRYAQWKIASLYVSGKSTSRFQDTRPQVEKLEDSVKVTYHYFMPTTPASECFLTYQVFGDGMIETTLTYDPVKELGDMPEFGLIFKFDADLDQVSWYGLGPAETYDDRKCGGKLGLYSNNVNDNMAQYLMPQECGNKCGVRKLKVTDKKGRGMEFMGDDLSVNVLPYTPHELENAMHCYELPEIHYTVVRVAKAQMGVAGDDSWGARTLPEHLIDVSKPMSFTFRFRGI